MEDFQARGQLVPVGLNEVKFIKFAEKSTIGAFNINGGYIIALGSPQAGIMAHADPDHGPDPQTQLHADTFHPTVKAWYFLNDVTLKDGPFCYVPGSHRLTPERLAWEKRQSLAIHHNDNSLSKRGSLRIQSTDLEAMSLPPVKSLEVPANTLIVADTFGFHARGLAARPGARVEVWGYSRCNPFLPMVHPRLFSMPILANRRIDWYWRWRDWLEKHGQDRNPWKDIGFHRPVDLHPMTEPAPLSDDESEVMLASTMPDSVIDPLPLWTPDPVSIQKTDAHPAESEANPDALLQN